MDCSARFSRSTIRSSRRRLERGFSLIEILVVVAIIGLLIGVIGPNVIAQFQSSKTKTAAIQSEEIRAALDTFAMDVGRYPSESEGLEALVDGRRRLANWNGPYLRDGKLPLDPWKQPYHYANKHGEIKVWSDGANPSEAAAHVQAAR